MGNDVYIGDLDKASVLAALFNNAAVLGMGFLHPLAKQDLTVADAAEVLERDDQVRPMYFDYVHGRVMKVDLQGDSISPGYYDRDNGPGKASEVIEHLRRTGETHALPSRNYL